MILQDNLNNVGLDNYGCNRIWFAKDCKSHHANGPSFIKSTGFKTYVINGQYHNPKGTAVIHSDGEEHYCLNDNYLTEKEWHEARG